MILVIDNYDSFTYNLVQYLGVCGADVVVRRNDAITLDGIAEMKPNGIMLSPGPCTPNESGVCVNILGAALKAGSGDPFAVPLFGVCLGHEAFGEVAGGRIRHARTLMHGKTSEIDHDGKGLFNGVKNPLVAVRYHSLVVDDVQVPEDLIVTATSRDDGEIMGLRHRSRPIEGVQFHPESVGTEDGMRIVRNFVDQVAQ